MNSKIAAFSLAVSMTVGCSEAEKSEESEQETNPIVGSWAVSSLDGACYEMGWENGDTLEFCYEYPQFSFQAAELDDGTIEISNIEGTIHFLTIATYSGQEPSTETDIMEVLALRLEVVREGAEYLITGDINENDNLTEDYLSLNCSLTQAGELDCDLDEGAEEGEEEIFPDFSLILIQE